MAGNVKFNYAEMNVYSPDGKLEQLDYIQKATELGNTCLALRNKTTGVLIAHNPPRNELAKPIKKVFEVNEKSLFSFAGITNDGLMTMKYLKSKSLEENVENERDFHPIYVFDELFASRAMTSVIGSSRLPGSSGLLLYDFEGEICLIEVPPLHKPRKVNASSIGFRNQSCKTILSNYCEKFLDENTSDEEMIRIGIRAMLNAHPEHDKNSRLLPSDLEIYLMKVGASFKKIDGSLYFE